MEFHGVVGDAEARRHFAVAKSLGEHAQDFDFAGSEVVQARRRLHCWRGDARGQILSDFGIEQNQVSMGGLNSRQNFLEIRVPGQDRSYSRT